MKIIRFIIVIIFLAEGITKLLGADFQVTFFTEQWGYTMGFMYLIGALETLGAIGLLIPKLRLWANIGLLGIMIGAFYTHLKSGDAPQMMGLAVLASVLLIIHLVHQRRAGRIANDTRTV